VIQHFPSASSGGPFERQGAQGDMTQLVAHLDAADNLARWLTRDQAEAEDMVQDAYLRGIQKLCRFSGRRRPCLALDDRTQWVLRPLEAEGHFGSEHAFRRGGTQCRPADP
jgi:hypothetical protein